MTCIVVLSFRRLNDTALQPCDIRTSVGPGPPPCKIEYLKTCKAFVNSLPEKQYTVIDQCMYEELLI